MGARAARADEGARPLRNPNGKHGLLEGTDARACPRRSRSHAHPHAAPQDACSATSATPTRYRGISAIAVVLALVAIAVSAHAADRTAPLPTGESAPEIRLTDQHGKAFVLVETLKQRDFVVIAFYPKAFTGG